MFLRHKTRSYMDARGRVKFQGFLLRKVKAFEAMWVQTDIAYLQKKINLSLQPSAQRRSFPFTGQ